MRGNASPQAQPNTNSSSSSSSSASSASSASTASVTPQLPGDMLAHAGSFLERGDRMRLSGMTSRENREPALSSLRAGAMQEANILSATRTVSTGEQFMNSLGVEGAPLADQPNSIRSLPLDRRAEPLAALALRINQLPHGERFGMNREFLNAFNTIPEQNRTPDLTALANVAAYSVNEFVDPHTAARRGANARQTALFYNIHDHQGIYSIERSAAISREPGSAGHRVSSGENVHTVANALGFTTQDGIYELERTAAISREPGSAAQRVASGENVKTVAEASGIVTQDRVYDLERIAAMSMEPGSAGQRVESGENVQTVANALGFTTQRGIYHLERAAALSEHPSGARQAMIAGETIDQVVQRFGFTSPASRVLLERLYATYIILQN
jgi:hypothetical protein